MPYEVTAYGADDPTAPVSIPAGIDVKQSVKAIYQRAIDGWLALSDKINSGTWQAGDQATKMQALVNDMNSWRKRFLTFLEPHAHTSATDWLLRVTVPGYGLYEHWLSTSDASQIYLGLQTYVAELNQFGERFAQISGQAQPETTRPGPNVQATEGIDDIIKSVMWVGIIGVGVWFGGQILLKGMDK